MLLRPGRGGERFSLWLMPTGGVRDRLSALIAGLASRCGAPVFPPHVTLLGDCAGNLRQIIAAGAEVAQAVRPFGIRLENLGCRDEYYRCLFVHAALTGPLRHAHQVARDALGAKRRPAFMPHLSLLYGRVPESLKSQLIAELGPRLDLEFRVRTLHLYRTSGEALKWRHMARFALND